MDNQNNRSYIAIAVVILIGIALSISGSQGGSTFAGIPVFTIGVALAFIINWIVFIPSFINKTEHFFDLTGGITYITVTILAVILSPKPDLRSFLLLAMVIVWAVRLSGFLFMRIRAAGEDRRFRELKKSFPRFLLTWTLQGLWVSFTLAAALVVITSERRVDLGIFALIGFILWLIGFGIEFVSDNQKSKFKADPANKDKFISTGLWAFSRHPNYFGEILLWVGVAIIALPVLQGWTWVALISPIFVTLLLTRVSGIPMLEERADTKWGGQPDYEAYKARTSVLVLLPPKKQE